MAVIRVCAFKNATAFICQLTFALILSSCESSNSVKECPSTDADCDDVLKAVDCNDSDANNIRSTATDTDCDGVLTAVDCDDASSDNARSKAIDADCDGVFNTVDCDDASAAVTPEQEVYVPGGPFTRGTLAVPHAEPVRTITLKPYCIDRTEVTNADFVVLLEQREASGQPNADDQDRDLYDIWDADDDFPQRLAKT